MLYIPCPWCGERSETEFHYGGEAHIEYPGPDVDDVVWSRYLFFRANPKQWHAERWVHSAGCRRWFNAWRETKTNEFGPTYKMFEEQPSRPGDIGI